MHYFSAFGRVGNFVGGCGELLALVPTGILMQETSLDLDVSKVGKISTKLKNDGAPDGLCTQCQVTFIRIVCPPTGKAKKMVASAFVVFLFLELL